MPPQRTQRTTLRDAAESLKVMEYVASYFDTNPLWDSKDFYDYCATSPFEDLRRDCARQKNYWINSLKNKIKELDALGNPDDSALKHVQFLFNESVTWISTRREGKQVRAILFQFLVQTCSVGTNHTGNFWYES